MNKKTSLAVTIHVNISIFENLEILYVFEDSVFLLSWLSKICFLNSFIFVAALFNFFISSSFEKAIKRQV